MRVLTPFSVFDEFVDKMENILTKLSHKNKSVIVCSDFDIDILQVTSCSVRLLNLSQSHNLLNVSFEPTRITSVSATCIDNVFCYCNI